MKQGGETAIGFRITSLKVSIYPGTLVGDEVVIQLKEGIIIPTDAGPRVFCKLAEAIGEGLLGIKIPKWILLIVWDLFGEVRETDKLEKFIPVTPEIATAA